MDVIIIKVEPFAAQKLVNFIQAGFTRQDLVIGKQVRDEAPIDRKTGQAKRRAEFQIGKDKTGAIPECVIAGKAGRRIRQDRDSGLMPEKPDKIPPIIFKECPAGRLDEPILFSREKDIHLVIMCSRIGLPEKGSIYQSICPLGASRDNKLFRVCRLCPKV